MPAPEAGEAGPEPFERHVISDATPALTTPRRPKDWNRFGPSGDNCMIQSSSSMLPGGGSADTSGAPLAARAISAPLAPRAASHSRTRSRLGALIPRSTLLNCALL